MADEEQEQHRQEELAKFYFDSFKHTSTLSAGAGAEKLLGGQVLEVVTVDMPLSIERITGRREADAAISRAFGGKGAAVHSPSVDRPGIISTKTREGFDAALHQKSILNQNLPS